MIKRGLLLMFALMAFSTAVTSAQAQDHHRHKHCWVSHHHRHCRWD